MCFPYAPRSYLRKLLMPFYAQNNFDFRLFERDGIILDHCALHRECALCGMDEFSVSLEQTVATFSKSVETDYFVEFKH